MKLLAILLMTLLVGCGADSTSIGRSPHGEEFKKPVCETGHGWSEDDQLCLPIVPPVTTPPPTVTPDPPPVIPETQVDSSLQTIVNEYVRRSGNALPSNLTYIKLTIEYDDSNIIGGCLTFPNGNKEIRIKSSYWNNQTTDRKKSLMFHELGHCIEDLSHTAGAGNGECTAQTRDNTAKVMDACSEKYTNAYALWYASDWNNSTLIEGPVAYTPWAFDLEFEDTTKNGYYIIYNSYTMTNMFATFFGE